MSGWDDDLQADVELAQRMSSSGTRRAPGGRKLIDGRGRQRKLACPEGCGTIVYATAGNIEANGRVRCSCGAELVLANFRDRWALEYDEARDELARASGETRRQLRRELFAVGYSAADVDEALGIVSGGPNAAERRRCAERTTVCKRWAQTGSAFCLEHDPAELERRRAADAASARFGGAR